MSDTDPLETLRGGLIVSCQAYPGEPLRRPEVMSLMAQAAVLGGAAGIRAQGLADIEHIHAAVQVPQIGLWKVGTTGVYVTPTVAHAVAVARAGAEIVAIDGTRRPRPDGRSLPETIAAIREQTGALIMADVGDLEDGLASEDAGADVISTTLAGYTDGRPATDGPDIALVEQLVDRVRVPVVAEGRIRTPAQAASCLAAGAFAVVVGTAITHPTSITRWFAGALAPPAPRPAGQEPAGPSTAAEAAGSAAVHDDNSRS